MISPNEKLDVNQAWHKNLVVLYEGQRLCEVKARKSIKTPRIKYE